MNTSEKKKLEASQTFSKLKGLLKEHYSIGLYTVIHPELLDQYIPESTRILNELAALGKNILAEDKLTILFQTFNLDIKPFQKEN